MAKRDAVPGLGAKLKAAREKAGLTQTAADEASGVAQTNIARYEGDSKTPSLATLYKLAAAYGIDICDLLPKPTEIAPGSNGEPVEAPAPAKKKPKKK